MSRVSEDAAVFGFAILIVAWVLVGLPFFLYMPEVSGTGDPEMQSTNWIPIVVSFLGGSVFTYLIK